MKVFKRAKEINKKIKIKQKTILFRNTNSLFLYSKYRKSLNFSSSFQKKVSVSKSNLSVFHSIPSKTKFPTLRNHFKKSTYYFPISQSVHINSPRSSFHSKTKFSSSPQTLKLTLNNNPIHFSPYIPSIIRNSNSQKAFGSKKKTLEEIYQQKTPIEHVLTRPDSYIGSIESLKKNMWFFKGKKIILGECDYIQGLLKIFDEILVNATDNKVRYPKETTTLKIDINTKDNFITIYNNGAGIPSDKHSKLGIPIPEMIFGNLLTGSNFNDEISKVTGGRNGYGAKLTNIFSTKFILETVHKRKKYTQEWTNNMTECHQAIIEESKNEDYTKVTFFPDLKRFKIKNLREGDTLKLMERRVHDVAGIHRNSLQVFLNSEPIKYSNLKEYFELYQTDSGNIVFQKINERWTIGICTTSVPMNVTFVNCISTARGGTHVNYILDQVAKGVEKNLAKKDKKFKDLNLNHIKSRLGVFISCQIENPHFDSQTKETLTSKISSFGSECNIPDKFIQNLISQTNISEILTRLVEKKNKIEFAKGVDSQGMKYGNKMIGIPKLYDAHHAGGKRKTECTLILTEGDSAKALAISGLSQIGHDFYGVFPLRGKILNVRDASHKKLLANEEVQILCKILGLQPQNQNIRKNQLRYGKVMIMADQDHDGSHIKGLLINFFQYFWPNLIEENFLQEFVTPIIKFTLGKEILSFFTIHESKKWLEQNPNKNPKAKYYKGLGTSSNQEAKEYFRNIKHHVIDLLPDPEAQSSLETAFSKDKISERKSWLLKYDQNIYIDHTQKKLTITDFVNKELLQFSHADNYRSIAHMMDGLKPGQRKILFGCFKKNLNEEIKVTQLAGYISEHAAYHHGETSLHSTITRMAQNFVGSNNINLLYPSGQFGTRFQGGKDAASARYIFTKLSPLTRIIFSPLDDPILEYLTEDGQQVEPKFYIPILPMVLVNGSLGLGTGWSSSIPMFNPLEISENLRNSLNEKKMKEMVPFYRGFRGKVFKSLNESEHSWIVQGVAEKVGPISNRMIKISEIPIGVWIDQFKDQLDQEVKHGSVDKSPLLDYSMKHTKDGSVHFFVDPNSEVIKESTDLIQAFKLSTKISGNNMHLFDSNGILKRYSSPLEIIEDFIPVRLDYYSRRKKYQLKTGEGILEKLEQQFQFCSKVIDQSIKISNQTHSEITRQLESYGFKKVENSYQYLLKTPIYNFSSEKMIALKNEKEEKTQQLNQLKATPEKDIWISELESFDQKYQNQNQKKL